MDLSKQTLTGRQLSPAPKQIHHLPPHTAYTLGPHLCLCICILKYNSKYYERGCAVRQIDWHCSACVASETSSLGGYMYSAATWAKSFPHLFPYGDGVFGLPRQKPMTFQQHTAMLLLREELIFDVTLNMKSASVQIFRGDENHDVIEKLFLTLITL